MRGLAWFLAILSLAAWLGAGTFAGFVVAPASFQVLPSRALAGDLNGKVLGILDIEIAVAAIVFLMATSILRREREFALTRRLLASRLPIVTVVAALVSRGIVAPKMAKLRAAMPVAIDEMAKTDPMRVLFGKLHAMSSSLMLVAMLSGLVAAIVLAAEIAARTRPADPILSGTGTPFPRFTPDDDAPDATPEDGAKG